MHKTKGAGFRNPGRKGKGKRRSKAVTVRYNEAGELEDFEVKRIEEENAEEKPEEDTEEKNFSVKAAMEDFYANIMKIQEETELTGGSNAEEDAKAEEEVLERGFDFGDSECKLINDSL